MAAIEGKGNQFADRLERRVEHRVVGLQPGECDDLRHQLAQAMGLGVHPRSKVTHGLRVVGSPLHSLGQQLDGTDRRLQLVGHIGDEVAAGLVDAEKRGAVLGQDEFDLVADHRDAHMERQVGHAGAPSHRGVEDRRTTSATRLTDPVQHRVDHHPVTTAQSEGSGLGIAVQHLVVWADDHPCAAQQVDDLDHLGHDVHGCRRGRLDDLRLELAGALDAPRRQAAEERPDHQCGQGPRHYRHHRTSI